MCTLTDGAVSIQAKLSKVALDRFENQYSRPLTSVVGKAVDLTSFEITATHLGPSVAKVQLLIYGWTTLNSSTVPLVSQQIKPLPIHQHPDVQVFLQQLAHFREPTVSEPLPATDHEPAPTETSTSLRWKGKAPVRPAVSNDEATDESLLVQPDKRTTPKKRSHSAISPTRPSSHRSVRVRTGSGDDEVIVQSGVNLYPPKQIVVNAPQGSSKILELFAKNRTSGANMSDSHEKALRLVGMSSEQMLPPSVPLIPFPQDTNRQSQTPSHLQSQSQALSQNLMTQIQAPSMEGPDPVPVKTTAAPRAGFETQAPVEDVEMNMDTQPKVAVNIPNTTPESAQPEPVVETSQSSLPVSNLPLPSHPTQSAHQAMNSTSSSHLLEELSSLPPPEMRAPSLLYMKYARRKTPANQKKLLDNPDCWVPSKSGTTFPHPSIPMDIINKLDEIAKRQHLKAEADANQQAALLAPASQDVDSSAPFPWSSSQPSETSPPRPPEDRPSPPPEDSTSPSPEDFPTRHRSQTWRRSTNLPPDSSAEDPMQVDDQAGQVPSSPPVSSVSEDSDDSEDGRADDFPEVSLEVASEPKVNLRQLPEFPMSPPENSSPPNAPLPLDAEPEKEIDVSQPNAGEEDLVEEPFQTLSEQRPGPSMQETSTHQVSLSDLDKSREISVSIDEDTVIQDAQPRVEVAASPRRPSSRVRDWGLKSQHESASEKRKRLKREFLRRKMEEKPVDNKDTKHETPVARMRPQVNGNTIDLDVSMTQETNDQIPATQAADHQVPATHNTNHEGNDLAAAQRANIIKQWQRKVQEQDEPAALHDRAALDTPDKPAVEPPVTENDLPVIERSAQSSNKSVRSSTPHSHHLANEPEPKRTSLW